MNETTQKFVEVLKQDTNVLGVILFGSYARGNNRSDSDVDLIVILQEGYKRAVETHNGQVFEIVYVIEKEALKYWEDNKDRANDLWKVAKILYDRDNVVSNLKEKVSTFLKEGKKDISESQLGQYRFDAEDQIKYVEYILDKDPTTASLILYNKVFNLTEVYFDINKQWIPAPKQRMEKIKSLSPELYTLLVEFYKDNQNIKSRIVVAKKIIISIF